MIKRQYQILLNFEQGGFVESSRQPLAEAIIQYFL